MGGSSGNSQSASSPWAPQSWDAAGNWMGQSKPAAAATPSVSQTAPGTGQLGGLANTSPTAPVNPGTPPAAPTAQVATMGGFSPNPDPPPQQQGSVGPQIQTMGGYSPTPDPMMPTKAAAPMAAPQASPMVGSPATSSGGGLLAPQTQAPTNPNMPMLGASMDSQIPGGGLLNSGQQPQDPTPWSPFGGNSQWKWW